MTLVIEAMVSRLIAARSHVDTDVRPYVCISEQCGNFPPSFATRKEWRTHMREKHRADWAQYIHRPSKWFCTFGHSPPLPFPDENLLLQHLSEEHSNLFPAAELPNIAGGSKAADPSEAWVCPL